MTSVTPRWWAEQLAARLTAAYLEERVTRGSRAKYEATCAHVPDVELVPYDRLSQPGTRVRAEPNKGLQLAGKLADDAER